MRSLYLLEPQLLAKVRCGSMVNCAQAHIGIYDTRLTWKVFAELFLLKTTLKFDCWLIGIGRSNKKDRLPATKDIDVYYIIDDGSFFEILFLVCSIKIITRSRCSCCIERPLRRHCCKGKDSVAFTKIWILSATYLYPPITKMVCEPIGTGIMSSFSLCSTDTARRSTAAFLSPLFASFLTVWSQTSMAVSPEVW